MTVHTDRDLRIGMIVPPSGDQVPPEAYELYPDGVQFVARSLGIRGVDAASFDEALARLPSAMADLLSKDVDAISLMGTSISFYTGWSGHARLVASMRELSNGLPVTTMADGIIRGLRKIGATRIVVGAAYNNDLVGRLLRFLDDAGFEVLAHQRLDIVEVEQVLGVQDDALVDLGSRLIEAAPDCDALLVSCGGLKTIEMTRILESRYGIPVVSSAVAGCHDAVDTARGEAWATSAPDTANDR